MFVTPLLPREDNLANVLETKKKKKKKKKKRRGRKEMKSIAEKVDETLWKIDSLLQKQSFFPLSCVD